jgi:serine palmitoyltransferase
LEKEFAKFLNKEDCIIFGMGYATNASTIPAVVGPGCLVISDSLNHSSIIHGCRVSGSKIRVFQHNDTKDLEHVIRDAIIKGQPRTHRAWKKILIIVEGIYSMEGECCTLPEIVRLKNKYKCYLWVDEAHSIGALGEKGGGVCQHFGIEHKEVDILMGTFTKSFASVGGYVVGTKALISHIRKNNFSGFYSTSMSPGGVTQTLSALNIISGADGTNLGAQKLQALKDNSNFFRNGLIDLGFQVYGDRDSPVIPMMLYYPAKMTFFSRQCLERGIAVVIVGFPAVPLLLARARFCISASHKREDLEQALRDLDELGDNLLLKFGSSVDLHQN